MSSDNKIKNQELFASRLRDARKSLGLTQAVLAKEAGVSVQSWSEYEAGRVLPRIDVLGPLASNGISLNWLLSGVGEMMIGGGFQGPATPNPENTQSGIIEEWVQHVREVEGHDGRLVASLMRDSGDFRDWFNEKDKKKANVA